MVSVDAACDIRALISSRCYAAAAAHCRTHSVGLLSLCLCCLQLWGRTLQAPAGSKSTFIPLGVDGKRAAKQSTLMLVTGVTKRQEDRSGIDFTLQPLPSREPAGAASFLDEDGLYRHAKLLGAKQQSEASALRRDGKPRVQFGGLTAAYLSKFILPEDYYKVHLQGDPQRAVTIPTIITVRHRAQAKKQRGRLAENRQ